MSNRFTTRYSVLSVLSAAIICAPPSVGQGLNGSVTGIVSDQSGAIVPGAAVLLKSLETNVASRMEANNAGNYTFPSVPIGNYELRVEAKGFKIAVRSKIVVEPAQAIRADMRLEVGDSAESVQVSSEADLLQTETSSMGTQVSRRMIADLPVSLGGRMRDPVSFITLTPGVTGSSSSAGGMRIGGSRAYSNEVLMDGMPLFYNATQNVPDITRPAFETIAEFRVEALIPPAEQGRTGGGVVLIASKSGTNEVHGNIVSFFRNNVMDSRRYNAKVADPNRQGEFTGSLGAPLVLPKIYDGKNKTFLFINYSGFRYSTQVLGATATVPTDKMKQGDFSLNAERIFDPLTAATSGARQQFPGNVIPANRFAKISTQLNAYLPQPNAPGFSSNFLNPDPAKGITDTDTGFIRFDHNISDKNRLAGSWRLQDNRRKASNGTMPKVSDETPSAPRAQTTVVSDDLIIRPNLVNHIQAGMVRFTNLATGSQDIGVLVPGAFAPGFPGIRFSGQGYNAIGYTQAEIDANTNLDLQDSVSWTRGSHNFKFGGRIDTYRINVNSFANAAGTYNFSQFATGQPGVSGTGNSYASFLLGLVDSASVYQGPPYGFRSKYGALYAQDDWKVSRRLTVNYGVRWEAQAPFSEAAGRVSIMDRAVPNPGAGGLPGAIVFAGDGQGRTGGKTFAATYLNGWGPRLGLAYQLTKSTVLRAGSGLFYAPLVGTGLNRQGFDSNISLSSQDGGLTPSFQFDAGWPAGVVKRAPFIDPTVANGQGTSTFQSGRSGSGRLGRTAQWQFGIQQSVKSVMVEATYTGTVAHGIPNNALVQVNQLDPKYLQLGSLLTRQITDPAVTAAGFGRPYPGFTGTLAQSLRAFPQYAGVTSFNTPTGNSTYHALFLRAQKRFANGLQFLFSYAFSKTLSDVGFSGSDLSAPQDQYNRRAEKSLADIDLPQRLVMSYSYRLPFGKGGRYLTTGILSQIVGGWSAAGIHTFQSGSTLRITTPNGLPIFNGQLRPNLVAGVPIEISPGRESFQPLNSLSGQQGDFYLNRAAFSVPGPYTLGNLGYFLPNVRGPGLVNEDLSFSKKIVFTERFSTEFRADMFNALNRRNLSNPTTDLSNSNFGRISAQSAARVMQLGFRMDF